MDKKIIKKNGMVISDKSDKTVTILIDRVKEHPKYKKKYTVSKKYQVHDENNECKIGEKVEISSCRPISRTKKFKVERKLK